MSQAAVLQRRRVSPALFPTPIAFCIGIPVLFSFFVLLSSRTMNTGSKLTAAALSTTTSTTAPKPAALIFLHGLGDTPAGWKSLERTLPQLQPSLSNLHYVFPPAPTIPITINGGMTMPGWFDLYDWPIGISARDDPDGNMKAVEIVEQEVTKLEQKFGMERDRIVVGGFSQGGAIALLAAYHSSSGSGGKKAFAGCGALSAWLTLKDNLVTTSQTPLFWGHGQYDDKVLFEQQAHGVEWLRTKCGVSDIESSDYPMGHESHPEEIEAFASFLDRVLYSSS